MSSKVNDDAANKSSPVLMSGGLELPSDGWYYPLVDMLFIGRNSDEVWAHELSHRLSVAIAGAHSIFQIERSLSIIIHALVDAAVQWLIDSDYPTRRISRDTAGTLMARGESEASTRFVETILFRLTGLEAILARYLPWYKLLGEMVAIDIAHSPDSTLADERVRDSQAHEVVHAVAKKFRMPAGFETRALAAWRTFSEIEDAHDRLRVMNLAMTFPGLGSRGQPSRYDPLAMLIEYSELMRSPGARARSTFMTALRRHQVEAEQMTMTTVRRFTSDLQLDRVPALQAIVSDEGYIPPLQYLIYLMRCQEELRAGDPRWMQKGYEMFSLVTNITIDGTKIVLGPGDIGKFASDISRSLVVISQLSDGGWESVINPLMIAGAPLKGIDEINAWRPANVGPIQQSFSPYFWPQGQPADYAESRRQPEPPSTDWWLQALFLEKLRRAMLSKEELACPLRDLKVWSPMWSDIYYWEHIVGDGSTPRFGVPCTEDCSVRKMLTRLAERSNLVENPALAACSIHDISDARRRYIETARSAFREGENQPLSDSGSS